MNLQTDLESLDDAMLAHDEADAPIEQWDLDEFDEFAAIGSGRAAWLRADELAH